MDLVPVSALSLELEDEEIDEADEGEEIEDEDIDEVEVRDEETDDACVALELDVLTTKEDAICTGA
jgi:hypothetical protein